MRGHPFARRPFAGRAGVPYCWRAQNGAIRVMPPPDSLPPSPSPPPSPVPVTWGRARLVFLSLSAIVLVALLVVTREVLLPFILAIIIAYVLTPLVARLEARRFPRAVAILTVYFFVLGGLYLGIASAAPLLFTETMGLVRDAPRAIHKLSAQLGPSADRLLARVAPKASEPAPASSSSAMFLVTPEASGAYRVELNRGVEVVQEENVFRVRAAEAERNDGLTVSRLLEEGNERFVHYAKQNAVELLTVGRRMVAGFARSIFMLFMTLMVAGYLIGTRERVIDFFRTLVPLGSRLSFDRLLFRVDRGLSGVVRGQLLICLVNGLLSAIGFWIFDLKYWPIISLVAAVGSLIPIFGSILSTVPAVLMGLTHDVWTALWVLLWILGIHQIEANILNPKIIGTAAKIHPCIVVFVLIVGEHFFGLWGALLAVPTWSIVQSVFLHFRSISMPDTTDTVLPLFERLKGESAPPVETKG